MSRIRFDIKYSVRKLLRAPGLAIALLLTIALGIGSNVSVQGFARGLTRGEFPNRSLDRTVSIFGSNTSSGIAPFSYGEYLFLKTHSDAFEWMGAARVSPAAIVMDDQSEVVSVAAVTSNLAGALGLPLGKGAVISQRMWREEFNSGLLSRWLVSMTPSDRSPSLFAWLVAPMALSILS
ncbi:MAG: hypothetical protein WA324_30510 [Bryobacteraceae bacterium]